MIRILSLLYEAYREAGGIGYDAQTASDITLRVAPYVNRFIVKLFQIEAEYAQLQGTHLV